MDLIDDGRTLCAGVPHAAAVVALGILVKLLDVLVKGEQET